MFSEGILNNLGHFSGLDIRNHDLTLTEGAVDLTDPFTHCGRIRTDGTGIMLQLEEHVAGNDPFGCMDKLYIPSFTQGTDEPIHGAGGNRRFYNDHRPIGTKGQDFLHSGNHIAGVNLLTDLIIGGGNGDNIYIRALILRGKADPSLYSTGKEGIQALLAKGGLTPVQCLNKGPVIIRAYNLHPMGCQHQSRRQPNISQTDYIYQSQGFLSNLSVQQDIATHKFLYHRIFSLNTSKCTAFEKITVLFL